MKLIKNGTLVTAAGLIKADLAIKGQQISAIAEEIPASENCEIIDAEACLVFPGFIDGHTHMDMFNGVTTTADDFYSGGRAAVAGGTTTLIDFATQDKGGSLRDALRLWHQKADGKCACNYGFHMALCDWNAAVKAELPLLFDEGVSSFKVYLAYNALRVDDAQLLDILKSVSELGGVLGVHCENGTLVNYLCSEQKARGHMTPAAHPQSRPAAVEAEAISRLLYIAQLAGAPAHIVHLSSAAGLAAARQARERGQTVYIESCPQYLLLDESLYESPGFEGAKYVISPPLRSREDISVLRRAVLDGEIDTLATDHCSYNFEGQKTLGRDDFTKIPNGAPGIEHRPALIYSSFVHSGQMDAVAMSRLLSSNPAKLFGLYPQKGCLAVGSDADIVVWRTTGERCIRAAEQVQNVDYTPFEGFKVTGGPETVLVNGHFALKSGKLLPELHGRYVKRQALRHPVPFSG